jgi:hypothetical protein
MKGGEHFATKSKPEIKSRRCEDRLGNQRRVGHRRARSKAQGIADSDFVVLALPHQILWSFFVGLNLSKEISSERIVVVGGYRGPAVR